MNWEQLLCDSRLCLDTVADDSGPGRNQFFKDYDRIVFSSPFRRLGRKTQVHPLAANDHIHTRLTHSIEVASVGRSLGILVGEKIADQLPPHIAPQNLGEIIQAACLAHDMGNPPFGHAGEDAIRSWFAQPLARNLLKDLSPQQQSDLLLFEGNAQSFRLVTQIEHNMFKGGMRLTYATLGALLKYPWASPAAGTKKKFSCFQAEEVILENVATTLGLVRQGDHAWCRHPLAFLVEAADDICYRILDLEDAFEMRILSFERVREILDPLCEKNARYHEILDDPLVPPRQKLAYLRGKSIGKAIGHTARAFLDNLPAIMQGSFSGELIDACPTEVSVPLNLAKQVARDEVFTHQSKIELELGAYTTLGILLDTLCTAVYEQARGTRLSYRSDRIIRMMGANAPGEDLSLYEAYMRVMDYLSGMTDSYATYIAKQIGGMAVNHS